MNTDEPYPSQLLSIILNINYSNLVLDILILIFLLVLSAIFSASENSLFSISIKELKKIEEENSPSGDYILKLLSNPGKLLATILISNNLVNVAFIIKSTILINQFLKFKFQWQELTFNILTVTLVLLIFGEIMPKVYATKNYLKVSRKMSVFIFYITKILTFITTPFVYMNNWFDNKLKTQNRNISVDELSHAIDITADNNSQNDEKEILKGIINFGNKIVKQIMKSRVDVVALEDNLSFKELLKKINEFGYSRFPVYHENFDNIVGILYIKDVLPFINESENFNWQKLLKQPFYVSENKRIDNLLTEFQEKRNHIAIVVDEYGGKLGMLTMEDILEEIFGEINDEFDEEVLNYSFLSENKYLVEGKMLINDFCRLIQINSDFFEKAKGNAESIAGLVLEINKKMPEKNDIIEFENFKFQIDQVDNRRIKRLKVEWH